MIKFLKTAICLILAVSFSEAKLKVVTLHPLLSDIARNVGGDKVEVIDLISTQRNIHDFTPTPIILSKVSDASLFLAMGKGLENYLPKIQQLTKNEVEIIEVGKDIVSIVISSENKLFACCPHDSHGALDPHWWHSIKNLRRAVQIVAKEFSKNDPANADFYKANAKRFRAELEQLEQWTKKELSKIPKSKRYLVTAHAAFSYFCEEYGFKYIPIQGLNAEQNVSVKYLSEANVLIKKNKVRAIFPEKLNNIKELEVIAKATGAIVGDSLYAGSATSINELFKNNVQAIVKGLSAQ